MEQNPAIATGAAVIKCPGGAYHLLFLEHEGIELARGLPSDGWIDRFVEWLRNTIGELPA